jgi:mono/diheme cytochrome c family protein
VVGAPDAATSIASPTHPHASAAASKTTLESVPAFSSVPDQAALPAGSSEQTRSALCQRGYDDPVSQALCAAAPPQSFAELLQLLGLDFRALVGNGELGNPAFALLSHSTSLSGQLVSPINPRVFLFRAPASEGPIQGPARPADELVVLAFSRGEPFVELATRDRTTRALRFLLLRFFPRCEQLGACNSWELFGPSVESDWSSVSLYADDDLENTVFDCNVCHRDGGPNAEKRLLMIQKTAPWTHFFRDKEAGKGLLDSYFEAHPASETYGGIPGRLIRWSEPALMQGLVEHEGGLVQPAELPTVALARMEMASKQPAAVPAFESLQQRALHGDLFPLPHPTAVFTDPRRQAEVASAYKALMGGDRARTLPDLSELHSESALRSTQRRPSANASGEQILIEACARCHNARLDQTVSRANFDPSRLGELSSTQLEAIEERLLLPPSSPLSMPPRRFAQLGADEVQLVRDALRDRKAAASR